MELRVLRTESDVLEFCYGVTPVAPVTLSKEEAKEADKQQRAEEKAEAKAVKAEEKSDAGAAKAEEKAEKSKAEEKVASDADVEALAEKLKADHSAKELSALADKLGLVVSGNKTDVAKLIAAHKLASK